MGLFYTRHEYSSTLLILYMLYVHTYTGHDRRALSVVGSRELCEIESVPAELAVRFNSSSTSEVRGVVKVNSDGIWRTVCSGERTFPPETAHVICRQMGYVAYLNISHVQME